jgi:hypothetical protein
MWLCAKKPPQRPQPNEVNQMQLFGPFFHQVTLHTARCGGNHFLPSDSYLGNGDPTRGACDPRSISQMLTYAPRMNQKLKESIWT